MTANPKIQVADLVLVDFRSRHLTPAIRLWKEQNAVPFAESCSRQIWYGIETDFKDFPNDSPNIALLKGADAYKLLLSLISGFESKRLGETHIRHQFFNGWHAFEQSHPDTADSYRSLIKQLKTDTTYIQDYITNDWKVSREEYAALGVSGQGKGDKILIVGSLTRAGQVSLTTTELIKVCESKQKPDRDFLSITHPDPEVLKQIEHDMRLLQSAGIIRLNIQYLPFEDLPQHLEKNDRIYVTMAMGSAPENEAEFVQTWNTRIRRDNTLICLRGKPEMRGASVAPWNNSQLDNYTSPEDVRGEMAQRATSNKFLKQRGAHAFEVFADLRVEGKSPRHNMTTEQKLELQII